MPRGCHIRRHQLWGRQRRAAGTKLVLDEVIVLRNALVAHPRERAASTSGELREVVDVQEVQRVFLAEDSSALAAVMAALEEVEPLVARRYATLGHRLVPKPVAPRGCGPHNVVVLARRKHIRPRAQRRASGGVGGILQFR